MMSNPVRRLSVLVLLVASCIGLYSLATGEPSVPLLMNYQGRLTDEDGNSLTGAREMTFRLYTQAAGGTAVWVETQTVQLGDSGFFNVLLGSVNALDASDFTGTTYLGVQVGGQAEMSPRRQVVSVAYALVAGTAENCDEDNLSDNSIGDLDDVNTAGAALNEVLSWNGSSWIPQGLPASNAWSLTGNSGTTPGTNFLGTTDNQAFGVHVNGQRALRIEPKSTSPNLIGGYSGNAVSVGVHGATIGGGGRSGSINEVTGNYGTVSGGLSNTASAGATVGGGCDNTASCDFATVGGGFYNRARDDYATVGGGYGNTARDDYATVGGGYYNIASNDYATVGGGSYNIASGV